MLAIRDGQWKLIDRSQRPGAHPPPPPTPITNPRVIARQKHIEQLYMPGAVDYPAAPLELYNLESDPGETDNVAKRHPDIVQRLVRQLAELRTAGHS